SAEGRGPAGSAPQERRAVNYRSAALRGLALAGKFLNLNAELHGEPLTQTRSGMKFPRNSPVWPRAQLRWIDASKSQELGEPAQGSGHIPGYAGRQRMRDSR